eukprot:766573-Hanusia_phi.AAC.6
MLSKQNLVQFSIPTFGIPPRNRSHCWDLIDCWSALATSPFCSSKGFDLMEQVCSISKAAKRSIPNRETLAVMSTKLDGTEWQWESFDANPRYVVSVFLQFVSSRLLLSHRCRLFTLCPSTSILSRWALRSLNQRYITVGTVMDYVMAKPWQGGRNHGEVQKLRGPGERHNAVHAGEGEGKEKRRRVEEEKRGEGGCEERVRGNERDGWRSTGFDGDMRTPRRRMRGQ